MTRGEAGGLRAEAYATLLEQAAAPKPSPMTQWLEATARLKATHDLAIELPARRGGSRKAPTFD